MEEKKGEHKYEGKKRDQSNKLHQLDMVDTDGWSLLQPLEDTNVSECL